MRTVDLRKDLPFMPFEGFAGIRQRTAHLAARMEELCEDGIVVEHGLLEVEGSGWVTVLLPQMAALGALNALADWGVKAQLTPQNDKLLFWVTGRVSFEDIDFLQGAVMEIMGI